MTMNESEEEFKQSQKGSQKYQEEIGQRAKKRVDSSITYQSHNNNIDDKAHNIASMSKRHYYRTLKNNNNKIHKKYFETTRNKKN